jgi:hypothetical protein
MDYAHRRVTAWIAVVCTMLVASIASAATLNVCTNTCGYKTVQSAVDAAAPGDTIRIYPGRYVGNITIENKAALTITGSDQTASQVLLVGTGVGPVFTLGANNGGPVGAVFISYVTVTGGSHFRGTGEGGGIQVRQGAALFLSNANVVGNSAAAGGGISVNTQGGPYSEIQSSCLISSNTAYVGGGVYVAPDSAARIEDMCAVTDNSATGNPAQSTPGLGGGIYAGENSQLWVTDTDISRNSVTAPCGTGLVGVPNCVAAGGGAYVLGQLTMSDAQITQNNVYNASGAALGGGLYVDVNPSQLIQGCAIANNRVYSIAESGTGGGIFAASTDPTVSWTLDKDFVVLNTAGDANQSVYPSAGGVRNTGKLSLANGSTIAGNVPVQCLGGKGCPAN